MPRRLEVPIVSINAPPAVITLKGGTKIKVQLNVPSVFVLIEDATNDPILDQDGKPVFNLDLNVQMKNITGEKD